MPHGTARAVLCVVLATAGGVASWSPAVTTVRMAAGDGGGVSGSDRRAWLRFSSGAVAGAALSGSAGRPVPVWADDLDEPESTPAPPPPPARTTIGYQEFMAGLLDGQVVEVKFQGAMGDKATAVMRSGERLEVLGIMPESGTSMLGPAQTQAKVRDSGVPFSYDVGAAIKAKRKKNKDEWGDLELNPFKKL